MERIIARRSHPEARAIEEMERIMNACHADRIADSAVYGIIVFVVFSLMIAVATISKQRRADRLPPGPPLWPIVGHLHLFKRDEPIHRTLYSLAQSYGPIVHLRLGCRPILVVSSSEVARECLTTNDKIFASRPQFAASEYLGYNSTMVGLHPYDQQWRNLRKISTLGILSAGKIEMWKHVRTEEVSALVRSVFGQADGNEKVNMRPRLLELSFNIIFRLVTGSPISGAQSPDSNTFDVEAHQVHQMVEEYGLLLPAFNIGDYLPFLRWLDLQGCERAMKKLHKRTDAFMQRLVDRRKRETGDDRLDTPADFIDVLLRSLADNDYLVKSTAMALIVAATDTSSATLEWALLSLLQQPAICRKAQQELDANVGRDRVVEESDLPKLKYLQAIVKETLRLYPALPTLLPHQSTDDCSVAGYRVPAGTRLLVNVWAIQRDPTVWERPLEFDPERFMNTAIDVRGQDFELIPFGSGRRAYPGTSLALLVLQLTLGRLLQSFDWTAPDDLIPQLDPTLSLSPPVPVQALVRPRLDRNLY